jgi:hypothetical protein
MIVKDVLVIHYNVLKVLTNNYFLQLRLRKSENVIKKSGIRNGVVMFYSES